MEEYDTTEEIDERENQYIEQSLQCLSTLDFVIKGATYERSCSNRTGLILKDLKKYKWSKSIRSFTRIWNSPFALRSTNSFLVHIRFLLICILCFKRRLSTYINLNCKFLSNNSFLFTLTTIIKRGKKNAPQNWRKSFLSYSVMLKLKLKRINPPARENTLDGNQP